MDAGPAVQLGGQGPRRLPKGAGKPNIPLETPGVCDLTDAMGQLKLPRGAVEKCVQITAQMRSGGGKGVLREAADANWQRGGRCTQPSQDLRQQWQQEVHN